LDFERLTTPEEKSDLFETWTRYPEAALIQFQLTLTYDVPRDVLSSPMPPPRRAEVVARSCEPAGVADAAVRVSDARGSTE
jgi:hypothetical protein